jgi:hypothetical protein
VDRENGLNHTGSDECNVLWIRLSNERGTTSTQKARTATDFSRMSSFPIEFCEEMTITTTEKQNSDWCGRQDER